MHTSNVSLKVFKKKCYLNVLNECPKAFNSTIAKRFAPEGSQESNSFSDLLYNAMKSHAAVFFLPSGCGFPRTFKTSALVGFWPKALITSPH